jgi:hypothetical protein
MTYRNLKAIIKALPIEDWIKTDIEMSLDDFIKDTLSRWLDLLETECIDSKNMVATDIQKILEELNKDAR